jgi:tRNA (adenine57-N1/adenine58-N1)-methyltransferase
VIYPKDLGPILVLADIHPGVRVLESGVGSGALSMTLVRAGADVVGYELRDDFAARARANVVAFVGEEATVDRYRVEVRDTYEGIDESDLDAVLLDLPEPWQVVPHAAKALRGGGTLVAYTPSVMQVATLRAALDDSDFELASTVEVLVRSWHVQGQAVRPDHRMVAHTGFLVTARRLAPGAELPLPARRASKSGFSDEDLEAWTPGALGLREQSPKRLRRTARQAAEIADARAGAAEDDAD